MTLLAATLRSLPRYGLGFLNPDTLIPSPFPARAGM